MPSPINIVNYIINGTTTTLYSSYNEHVPQKGDLVSFIANGTSVTPAMTVKERYLVVGRWTIFDRHPVIPNVERTVQTNVYIEQIREEEIKKDQLEFEDPAEEEEQVFDVAASPKEKKK